VQPRWAATRNTQAGLPDGHDTAPPHPCTPSAYSAVVANQTAVLDEPGRPPGNPATVPRGLDPVSMRAWRTFLVAHAQVTRQLGVELEAEQQLPLASYDVLVQLAEAPQRCHSARRPVAARRPGRASGLPGRCARDARGADRRRPGPAVESVDNPSAGRPGARRRPVHEARARHPHGAARPARGRTTSTASGTSTTSGTSGTSGLAGLPPLHPSDPCVDDQRSGRPSVGGAWRWAVIGPTRLCTPRTRGTG